MLKFLARSDKAVAADDVVSAERAEAFLRLLPQDDPVAARRAVCDALMSIKGPRGPEVDRLQALQTLERGSQQLLEHLLSEYASPNGLASERETRLRQPIVELSRSFAQAYEHFYRHLREHPDDREWLAHAPSILVSLLKQREIELLLALFRYEKFSRARWKDTNGLYAFALEQGLARAAVPAERRSAGADAATTVEQAFIRILLLQLTAAGQLLPIEIAMAREWIGRWCAQLALTPASADDVMDAKSIGFRIDLSGSHGLKRASSLHSVEGHHLRLDTSPLAPAFEQASAAVRGMRVENASAALERSRQVTLLTRLAILLAAERPRVRRRGERTKVQSVSVRVVIGGLQSIGRILRNESRKAAEAQPAHVEEITIGDVSDYTTSPVRAVVRDVAGGFLPVVGVDGLEPLWQVQDRSESGCLLRGQTLDNEQSLPGSLMALREHDAPWQVAVVRRLDKVGGALVELGVEYVGRNPQRVVILSDRDGDKQDRFVALYLPESDAGPRIPIKTLIVPAHKYEAGRVLTIVSTASETPIRLKDPIEQQLDFVWASFDLVESERRR